MKIKIMRNQEGFTLIETMIAMAIISISFLGCAALYLKANANNYTGNHYSNAAFVAKTQLDSYKNWKPSDINDLRIGTLPPVFTDKAGNEVHEEFSLYTTTVTVENTPTGIGRIITCQVTWDNPRSANAKAVEYKAIVRGNGI